MPPGEVPGSASVRGSIVARALAGSWRADPPVLEVTREELALVVPALYRSGCSGLVWRRVGPTPLGSTPAASLLHDGFVYHTLRVRRLEAQLSTLVSLLRDRGVEAIVGKGWAVGHRYPLVGLRPYGDLDLLVRSTAMDEAREVLLGWEGLPPSVELHLEFNELRDRGLEDLFQRSRLEELDGVPIRVFAPEDHLRLLTLHALEHGLARPFWLCDIALVLETLPADFDWDLCVAGGRWEGEGIRCALGLVGELLGVDLEGAGVPAPWRVPPLPWWLVPAALRALGATEHYLQAGSPNELLLSPVSLFRAARLRWANPLESTFRRRVPWNWVPRFPVQLVDYLIRAMGFALCVPASLWRLLVRTETESEP